jgi:hypothetical protein
MMFNEATINKLHETPLSAMAHAFRQQMDAPSVNRLSFYYTIFSKFFKKPAV